MPHSASSRMSGGVTGELFLISVMYCSCSASVQYCKGINAPTLYVCISCSINAGVYELSMRAAISWPIFSACESLASVFSAHESVALACDKNDTEKHKK